MSGVKRKHDVLRHSSDAEPGITRKRHGPLLGLFRRRRKRVTDRDEIDRLNAIGLPPAYATPGSAPTRTAISRRPAIDARGRKQYRYHPDFRAEAGQRQI